VIRTHELAYFGLAFRFEISTDHHAEHDVPGRLLEATQRDGHLLEAFPSRRRPKVELARPNALRAIGQARNLIARTRTHLQPLSHLYLDVDARRPTRRELKRKRLVPRRIHLIPRMS
jgi:hypothetical protein